MPHFMCFLVGLIVTQLILLTGAYRLHEGSMLGKWGFFTVASYCVVLGCFSFYVGASLFCRYLSEPARWSSAVNGVVFAFLHWVIIGMPASLSAGRITFTYLFPLLALAACAVLFKRPNRPLQDGRQQSGGV